LNLAFSAALPFNVILCSNAITGGGMREALVLAGGLGFLLGLRYRVPAVVPVSAVMAVMGSVVAYLSGAGPWLVVLAAVGAVTALQCGYLAGLLLTFLTAPRAKPRHDHDLGTPGRFTGRFWANAKD
jgi:hypothetical protein